MANENRKNPNQSKPQQQQGGNQKVKSGQSEGELGTEIDDEEDDLTGDAMQDEDDDRITQRTPAQRGGRVDSPK